MSNNETVIINVEDIIEYIKMNEAHLLNDEYSSLYFGKSIHDGDNKVMSPKALVACLPFERKELDLVRKKEAGWDKLRIGSVSMGSYNERYKGNVVVDSEIYHMAFMLIDRMIKREIDAVTAHDRKLSIYSGYNGVCKNPENIYDLEDLISSVVRNRIYQPLSKLFDAEESEWKLYDVSSKNFNFFVKKGKDFRIEDWYRMKNEKSDR